MEGDSEADRGSAGSWNAERILPFLRSAGPLSAALSRHVAAVLRAGDYARADRLEHDTGRIVDAAMKAAMSTLAVDDVAGDLSTQLRRSADHWAREGVPVLSVLGEVHEGFRIASRVLVDATDDHEDSDLADIIGTVIDLLDAVTATVIAAYVDEDRATRWSQRLAEQAAVTALLEGHPVSSAVRAGGISVADSYTLLAFTIGRPQGSTGDGPQREYLLRRTQRRVQDSLDAIDGAEILSLIGLRGGTVLVAGSRTFEWLDALIERMSADTGVDITAAFVEAATADLPSAAAQAHQLIEVAQRLDRRPGLHRVRDLALAYQLLQPGPGRDHLVEVLEPLRAYPELVHTLRVHIRNDLHRQRSARELRLHANSLDNRLKRIGELTGLSVTKPPDLATLHAALIVSAPIPEP